MKLTKDQRLECYQSTVFIQAAIDKLEALHEEVEDEEMRILVRAYLVLLGIKENLNKLMSESRT